MQQVSTITQEEMMPDTPLTFAVILRALLSNQITPEIKKFLDDNGMTYDTAIELKTRDGGLITCKQSDLDTMDTLNQMAYLVQPKEPKPMWQGTRSEAVQYMREHGSTEAIRNYLIEYHGDVDYADRFIMVVTANVHKEAIRASMEGHFVATALTLTESN